jgi:RHS repeat-associated protein
VFDQRYDGYGVLVRIERQGLKLWEAKQWDAAARLTSASLGNGLIQAQSFNNYTARLYDSTLATAANAQRVKEGYTYDVLGNVQTRTVGWDTSSFNETFHYDELNRIDWSQVNGQAQQSFAYDASGNITSKTGVGTYAYPTQGAGAVRPHTVQSVSSVAGSFTYDLNGNRTSMPGRSESWTSFDMPDILSKTIGGSVYNNQFTYGAEHQRTRQIKTGAVSGSVVYAGAQEVETVGSTVKVKTYWPLGLGMEVDNGGTTTLYWSHKDNLGSPVALSDASGNLAERMAYDVWGKRRTLTGAPDGTGSATPDNIDGVTDNRGFTGHEMLDQIDLVHMNGREYDPLLARFLSADPYIQDPANGQSYNRYSYVLNNPTNLTDPTGFAACEVGRNDCTTPTVVVSGEMTKNGHYLDRIETRAFMSGTPGAANFQVHVVGKFNGKDGTKQQSAKFGTLGAGSGTSANNNTAGAAVVQGANAGTEGLGNASSLGQSGEKIKRPLVAGEVTMLKDIFGNSVDYTKVELQSCCALPTASGTTFGNNIKFDPQYYRSDFSQAENALKALLGHEMTHVWQYQNSDITGYTTLKAAWESIRYGREGAYVYKLDPQKPFSNYRYEQQGQIIQDYMRAKIYQQPVNDFESVIYQSIKK